MQLIVNGAPQDQPEAISISGLIEALKLSGRRCAVEVNGLIVPRSAHADTRLQSGDRVEIVQAVGGG
jgi:sulfur carrier protein